MMIHLSSFGVIFDERRTEPHALQKSRKERKLSLKLQDSSSSRKTRRIGTETKRKGDFGTNALNVSGETAHLSALDLTSFHSE